MSPLKRILLVEDSPRDAELILDALDAHQLANEVVHVRDGADALDYLYRRGEFAGRSDESARADAAGLETAQGGRTGGAAPDQGDPALKMIPVVMMTSSRQEQDLVHSYQLGVNAYVVKPLKFQDFVEAVKQVGGFWAVINEVPPRACAASEGRRVPSTVDEAENPT